MPSASNVMVAQVGSAVTNVERFAHVPVDRPTLIAIVHPDLPEAATLAAAVGDELPALGPNVVAGPSDVSFDDAAAAWRLLIVLLTDGTRPVRVPASLAGRAGGDAAILPVLPYAQREQFQAIYDQEIRIRNGAYWFDAVDDVVPAMLAASGITTLSPRVFISYKRSDTLGLAMQLFDALSHAGFDVFLDKYRIDPGADFQAKLTESLGDKAMVIVLESKKFLDSEWTKREILTAKTHRLTICALRVPNGTSVAWIIGDERMLLDHTDFVAGVFSDTAVLDDAPLKKVVSFVRRQHDCGIAHRRSTLRKSIENALAFANVDYELGDDGAIRVPKQNSRYLIWPNPRPPELADFHTAYRLGANQIRGVVVGLSQLFAQERSAQMLWLSGISTITLVDEGQILAAAREIAAGNL